jgi:hypothetical protein
MYKVARVDGNQLEKFLNDLDPSGMGGNINYLSIFPIEGLADYFTVVYSIKAKKVASNPPPPPPNVNVKKGA